MSSARSRILKAIIVVGLIAIAGAASWLVGGRRYLRKRALIQAASNACTCFLGKRGGAGINTSDLLDGAEVTAAIDPTYRDWPARCRSTLVEAIAAHRLLMPTARVTENEAAMLERLDEGSPNEARAFIDELRSYWDTEADPNVRIAPPLAKALVDLTKIDPFVDHTSNGYPIQTRVEHGRLDLTFDSMTTCTIEANAVAICEAVPQEGWIPLEHANNALLLFWSPDDLTTTTARKRSGRVVDVHGETRATLEDFRWGRSFADGHVLVATQNDHVVRVQVDGRKVTPLPVLPIPKGFLREDTTHFFDHWAIRAHTNGVSVVDLEKQPFAAVETDKAPVGAPFEKTWSTCAANASYVDVGGTFAIVTTDTWTFQPLDQVAHGRHIFCDGNAAVVTDWHPLAFERCDDATCTPIPGRTSGTSWDTFGADVEHVWQIDNSKPFLIARVWSHAHPEQKRAVPLVVGEQLSRKSWGLRQPSALQVLKGRAFLMLETKAGKAVVLAIGADATAKVVVAK